MSTVQLLKAAEFIPLSDVRSLVGQPLQLSVPEGEITKEGVRLILEYLGARKQLNELAALCSS